MSKKRRVWRGKVVTGEIWQVCNEKGREEMSKDKEMSNLEK